MATELILDLSIIFILVGLLLLLSNYFKWPTIPFYILAGIVAGLFIETDHILELAYWGIAFLVFVFGVSIDFSKIKTVIWESEITVGLQLLVLGPISLFIGVLLGLDIVNAFYFAVAVVLSSTIIGFELKDYEKRESFVHGRLSQTIHFFDDLLAILIVLILSAEVFTAVQVGQNLLAGVLLVVTGFLIYRYLFKYMERITGGSGELLLMGSITILIIFLGASEFLGISIVVGAFAAGIAVRTDIPKSMEMINGIESIKDFFIVLFFTMLGALLSMPNTETLILTAGLLVLAGLLKPVVNTGFLVAEGYDTRTSTLTSISTDQISEFTLIIAIEGFLLGLIAPELFDAIILAAAILMIYSTYTHKYDEYIYRNIMKKIFKKPETTKTDELSNVDPGIEGHVILVGHGRLGKKVLDSCVKIGCPTVVIENDPAVRKELEEKTDNYIISDAVQPYTWEKARYREAKLIISTAADIEVTDKIMSLDTDADKIVRCREIEKSRKLLKRGALYVIIPNILSQDKVILEIQEILKEKNQG
ncbi:cation:proton antiporter [Methanonatronarchaeum sp. AMET6-2]|uniref:cation:proton antiporter n=1 Tax=Methanonatronarchaeum sp. AMET6-2 TaxID=2933293 RepID=UPI00120130B8|nr:cation:proton antiporter [Methanonatronarchaeum sp. AMET6-2]RZN62130.1 MAG: potassium transporter Kef [Methanonatronarchaeia archaeon]UOY09647.1 cation:proton antiporter [Methanonatronarchaeum sp. AMET6-2]